MLWITLTNNHVVDLELETHNHMNPTDFIAYMEDWVERRPVLSKAGYHTTLDQNEVPDFCYRLYNHNFMRVFIIRHYGDNVWDIVNDLMRTHMGEWSERNFYQPSETPFSGSIT